MSEVSIEFDEETFTDGFSVNSGPIKVNLEFRFSFVGCSFFGSEHEHLFGFQTQDLLHISISVLTEKKVHNRGFDSRVL